MDEQSDHIAVAIDTKLLSERLDSSVIMVERGRKGGRVKEGGKRKN